METAVSMRTPRARNADDDKMKNSADLPAWSTAGVARGWHYILCPDRIPRGRAYHVLRRRRPGRARGRGSGIWKRVGAAAADRSYVVEFRTAEGAVLAISIPRSEAAVIQHFQQRMPYGLSGWFLQWL
jgi:hypothetical protein